MTSEGEAAFPMFAPKRSDSTKRRRAMRKTSNMLKLFCLNNFHFETRLPFTKWIRNYKLSDFTNDLIAGIIIAFIMAMQAIAIAMVVGVKPEYGLYSCIFGGFVNFFFGTSKDISTGPTILAAVVVGQYNFHQSPQAMSIAAFFNGIVFLFMSFINLGFLMEFVSYPVLTGWMSSGALTISISQIPSWFGIGIPNASQLSSYELFIKVMSQIPSIQTGDFLIGLFACILSLILFFLTPKISSYSQNAKGKAKYFFTFLLYLAISRVGWIIIVSSIFCNVYQYIASTNNTFTFIGEPPSVLPTPWNPFVPIVDPVTNQTISTKQIISEIYPTFIMTPLVILIETLASARLFGKKFNYLVDNNQELMCLGIANLITGIFRGFSIGGALARTSVNALSGCKSLVGGLITSILLIPTILWLSPYFQYISKASLGACIFAAAITQVQVASLKNLWFISKLQIIPWVGTFLFGLYRLEVGMIVGFIISSGFILFRELRPRIHTEHNKEKECVTLYIKGAIHFPGAYSLYTRIRSVSKNYPNVKKLIIDCTNMYKTDTSVVEEMKEAIAEIKKEFIKVTIKHLKRGRVQKLAIGAGLAENVVKGMRTQSCITEFYSGKHHHHMIAFHRNPRDLYPTNEIVEESASQSFDDDNVVDQNYLYSNTIRSNSSYR